VLYRPGVTAGERAQCAAAIGARPTRWFERVRTESLRTPPGWTVERTVAALRADPRVLAVSPNHIRRPNYVGPAPAGHLTHANDPEYELQWYLNNRGTNLAGRADLAYGLTDGIIDADVDAPQAWEHTADCSDIVVAIFDAGVDIAHPDFGGPFPAGNIWTNVNDAADGLDNDANGIIDDVHGANFSGFEMHSERIEARTVRVEVFADLDADGDFDANEPVYHDVDLNLMVSAVDVLLAGAAAPAGSDLAVFPASIRHTENVAANQRFDPGESVYDDANGNNMVDAAEQPALVGANQANGSALVAFRFPTVDADDDFVFEKDQPIYTDHNGNAIVDASDTKLAGDAAPAGSLLWPLPPNIKHSDGNDNEYYDAGEGVYDDADGDNLVDAGEHQFGAADGAGTALVGFLVADGVYRTADSIYYDVDADQRVSPPDVRLSGPALPNGAVLANFHALVVHADDVAANDVYDGGEAIYIDVPGGTAGQVDAGDVLLAGAAQANTTPLLPFVARANGDVSDVIGHGTNCASVVGAFGNNCLDVAGVCWRVQLLPVKVADVRGASTEAFVAGVDYVLGLKAATPGRYIINFSYGGYAYNAVESAVVALAGAADILFVCSAGNERRDNNPDGQQGEPIYRDAAVGGMPNGNGTVDAADMRLSAYGPPSRLLAAGAVAAADVDAVQTWPLKPLAAFSHTESVNANGDFDDGERIYVDADADGKVSAGDVRLAFFVAGGNQYGLDVVNAADPDVNDGLVPFNANEKFVDLDDGPVGNVGSTPCIYPHDNLICVGASDIRDNLARFSNWGTQTVHLNAPGADIRMLRRAEDGGGTEFANGTSFAAPVVAGLAAHLWTFDAELTPLLIRGALLSPDVGDPRFGLRGTAIAGIDHDMRARMFSGADFGDAPDPLLGVAGRYPTLLLNNGANHEDIGEEWLGRAPELYGGVAIFSDVSPEVDADGTEDVDGVANLIDSDAHDDGVVLVGPFTFTPPGAPVPNTASVEVYIDTANNQEIDLDGGRYGGGHDSECGAHRHDVLGLPDDDKYVWVNGFFDWNGDGDWDDPDEHVFTLRADPSTWPISGGVYHITFDMPTAPFFFSETHYARFRLDYGENLGQGLAAPGNPVGPSLGGVIDYWNDPGLPGLPGAAVKNRYESDASLDLSYGLAQFGEVEDYAFAVEVPPPTAVGIVSANPPLDNPYVPGTQPFRDVLDTGVGATLIAGIGGAGTLAQGPIQYSPITVTFSAAPSPPPAPDNITVICTGGACPTVTAVSGSGPGPYEVYLSSPIPPGHCTTLVFAGTAAGQALRYQSQPGNVGMDSLTNTQDLLALIQALNNGAANQPANLARYNVNRLGAVNTQDLLRIIQLLNGVNTTESFNGDGVAVCP